MTLYVHNYTVRLIIIRHISILGMFLGKQETSAKESLKALYF